MPWSTLESVPGQSAVAATWRGRLGNRYPAFSSAFLQRNPAPARHFPCPRDCGCAHEIIPHPDGELVAVCRCEVPDCDDLCLSPADIVVWDLSWSKLERALCSAFGLGVRVADLSIHNTRQIGSWSADAVPVILTIQSLRSAFRSTVAELAAVIHKPFILLAPTSRHLDANSLDLLHHAGAAFFDLQSSARLAEDGTIVPAKSPTELFEQFIPASLSPSSSLPHPSSARSPRFGLRKGLGLWRLTFDGKEAELKHERGIFYVAYLLKHPPDAPLHALDLMAKIPELYREQIGLAQMTDPATGKAASLESHARLQERSLALDDAQTLQAIHRKEKELEAILDDENESEPVKQEALRELEAIAEFQRHHGRRTQDNAQRAVKAVRKAIARFHQHLHEALDQNGSPHSVLRPFAVHLQQHLLIPSARYSGPASLRARGQLAGCFTYNPPAGITWHG